MARLGRSVPVWPQVRLSLPQNPDARLQPRRAPPWSKYRRSNPALSWGVELNQRPARWLVPGYFEEIFTIRERSSSACSSSSDSSPSMTLRVVGSASPSQRMIS
jgi:hypothetical protein